MRRMNKRSIKLSDIDSSIRSCKFLDLDSSEKSLSVSIEEVTSQATIYIDRLGAEKLQEFLYYVLDDYDEED